jgi:predicted MFS family arabinose efflux permease
MSHADDGAARLSTRLSFFVAGFGIACWAPLVPFAKTRLAVDDSSLGVLLLCLGLGSVFAMLATGPLSGRYGSKPVILIGGIGMAILLPMLTIASAPISLGVALFAFGAALGSLDVAMNIHAVHVERTAGQPLMSGFHALFSIGGFAGAALITFLFSAGVSPLAGTLSCSAAMLLAMLVARPRLLSARPDIKGPPWVLPRGVVLLLAALTAVAFLTEGAMLDWSALLITQERLVQASRGGLGYMLFAMAMTAGRFSGDAVVAWIGDRVTLVGGGIIAIAGFVLLLTAWMAVTAMVGFVLLGIGAANIVPVLFRLAGAQRVMPPELAIAAITLTGYAGILIGPAAIGFVAQALSLRIAFWILAALISLVPLAARFVTARS